MVESDKHLVRAVVGLDPALRGTGGGSEGSGEGQNAILSGVEQRRTRSLARVSKRETAAARVALEGSNGIKGFADVNRIAEGGNIRRWSSREIERYLDTRPQDHLGFVFVEVVNVKKSPDSG